MAEKVIVLIDGGNMYRLLKQHGIYPGKRFDYGAFVNHLLNGRQLVSKTYYIGIVRNHDGAAKSQQLVEKQQKFLASLEADGFDIERGKIVYDHKIREKGVDVKIAIDLVIGAAENTYDTAIVISSDTDLIPAVKYVIGRGKKIEYVGFSVQPSLGMAKECTLSILLPQPDVDRFATRTNPGFAL